VSTSTAQEVSSRDKLLRAAIDLFAERGYHDTTIEAVATRAGVSRGSIFWHFGSKDDLVAAVIDETLTRWLDGITARTRDLQGPEGLEAFFGYRKDIINEDLALIRLIHVAIGSALTNKPEFAQPVLTTFDQIVVRLAHWLEEAGAPSFGGPTSSAELAGIVLYAICGATELWLLDPRRFDLGAAYDSIARVAGLGERSPGSRPRRP
jgi:AcrR family transcriptional regulator